MDYIPIIKKLHETLDSCNIHQRGFFIRCGYCPTNLYKWGRRVNVLKLKHVERIQEVVRDTLVELQGLDRELDVVIHQMQAESRKADAA